MANKISLTVNGKTHTDEVDGRMLLVHYLRDKLRLTGTHVGCDTSNCGSCTVHLDGMAVKSCTLLAAQADGCEVTTIEGLANNGELHPLQAAFKEEHGLQWLLLNSRLTYVGPFQGISPYEGLAQSAEVNFV